MATDKDTVFIASARTDDTVNIVSMNLAFPKRSFSIAEELGSEKYDSWLNYLEATL
jgi:galactokinase